MAAYDFALKRSVSSVFRPLGRAGVEESLQEIMAAFMRRAEGLRMEPRELADRLPGDFDEAVRIWGLAARGREAGFFDGPACFEVLGELAEEWAQLNPVRTLRVLVLGAQGGYEAVSLAMELSQRGFLVKDWELRIDALDLSREAVSTASSMSWTEADMGRLAPEVRRRHFKFIRGGWSLKEPLRGMVRFGWGDPFIDHRDNLLPSFEGKVDLLLARGFFRDVPDNMLPVFQEKASSMLADGGLALLGPGELWVPEGRIALEERRGVFYLRASGGRMRANRFFHPKGGKAALRDSLAMEPKAPSARLRQLRRQAMSLLRNNEPWKARAYALECISSAQTESGSFSPPDYRVLADAEEMLGRPGIAGLVRSAMELAEGG
jgi:chemotaxis methyl-accepting protein methylase